MAEPIIDRTSDIDKANAIYHSPIGKVKEDFTKYTDKGDKFNAAIQYNIMLDNATISGGTMTTIEIAGLSFELRLLCAEETIAVKKEVLQTARDEQIMDSFYLDYLDAIKTLAKASTPNPFKSTGKGVWEEKDFKLLVLPVLGELYNRYLHFVDMAVETGETFTEEELKQIIDFVKKKNQVLITYDRRKLLIAANYFKNYSERLELMLKSEPTS